MHCVALISGVNIWKGEAPDVETAAALAAKEAHKSGERIRGGSYRWAVRTEHIELRSDPLEVEPGYIVETFLYK